MVIRKGSILFKIWGRLPTKINRGSFNTWFVCYGVLVNKWTHVNIPLEVSRIKNQTTGVEDITTVQMILDQLMPGLVPLLLTFGCMWLLRHKVNALWIIIGFFGLGILGAWLKFLAP